MDKGYENEKFAGMRIKISVARKFRKFSRKQGISQSMALLKMIDFFSINGVSPDDDLGETISSLKHQMKTRFNALIAIVRSIEKDQTIPTVAMLQSLFEQQFESEHDNEFLDEDFEFIETKFENVERDEACTEETTIPKIRYDRLEEKMEGLKADFSYVLSKVKAVKHSFGKDYLKLELSLEEIEKYKRSIKNV